MVKSDILKEAEVAAHALAAYSELVSEIGREIVRLNKMIDLIEIYDDSLERFTKLDARQIYNPAITLRNRLKKRAKQ